MADITVSNDVDALMRSADNEAIRTSIGVPTPEEIMNPLVEGQGLLNSFVGSAAAYSLRDLNKTNPDIVEVRRGSDETSRVFKANEIGSTLENWVNAEVALPLDTASGAAAAYSLRNLSTSYSGNVVDVRRSSDDTEASFTAAEVAGSTMVDWVNAASITNGTFVNYGARPYETFTGATPSGVSVTNTTGEGWLSTELNHTFNAGDTVTVSFDINIVSGSPNFRITDAPKGIEKAPSQLVTTSGSKVLTFVLTGDGGNFISAAEGDSPSEFTISNFQVTSDNVDGHVTKWYDQSGNDNHAVQATPASQPKVVEGGTLVADGLKFDGVDDYVSFANPLSLTNGFLSFVSKLDTSETTQSLLGATLGSSDTYLGILQSGSTSTIVHKEVTIGNHYQNGSAVLAPTTRADIFNLFVTDNTQILTLEGITTTQNLEELGRGGGAALDWFTSGTIQEIIIYDSDQSAFRKNIEFNINNAYSIY